MKAKDLDKIFNDGEVDINSHLDLSRAFRPSWEQKRVNVDFPTWMIIELDKESSRLGVLKAIANQDLDCGTFGEIQSW